MNAFLGYFNPLSHCCLSLSSVAGASLLEIKLGKQLDNGDFASDHPESVHEITITPEDIMNADAIQFPNSDSMTRLDHSAQMLILIY